MDRQQIGLKLALDALGRELTLEDFAGRLALQKTIYLVQAAGVDLGYSYGWYLRGPYSAGLTRDAFAIKAELARDPEGLKSWKLDPDSINRLVVLRALFTGTPAKKLTRHLELLASVLFLLKSNQGQPHNPSKLREVLLQNKKDFSEAEIKDAIQELGRHGLWPTATTR